MARQGTPTHPKRAMARQGAPPPAAAPHNRKRAMARPGAPTHPNRAMARRVPARDGAPDESGARPGEDVVGGQTETDTAAAATGSGRSSRVFHVLCVPMAAA